MLQATSIVAELEHRYPELSLQRYLHDQLGTEIEVVGIAKNGYKDAPATAITRGQSGSPLRISSTADQSKAAEHVADMAGDSRIPFLLKRADSLARATLPATTSVVGG